MKIAAERHAEQRKYLESLSLFAGLRDEVLIGLARAARVLHVPKGEYLYFKTDPADAAYIVRSGWIIIVLGSSDGREMVINEVRSGELFGEQALLAGECHSASALARETSDVLEISRQALLQALDADPQLARRLLDVALCRLVAGHERESAMAFLDAQARLARTLLTLDAIDRQTTDRGYVVASQDELAQRTGLTRQTVARVLGRWRRLNWLITGRGRVMILNAPALRKVEEESVL